MDTLEHFLSQVRFTARHLFSDRICGRSPTHYAGNVGYLHFFRGGKLTVLPEGEAPFTLVEPSLIFYPGTWPHRLHGDETVGARMLCSVIDSEAGMRRAVNVVLPRVFVIPVSQLPMLHQTLDLLVLEADRRQLGWRLSCDRLFEYLIAQILRQAVDNQTIDNAVLAGFGDARLARSLTALTEDIKKDWSISALAHLSGMSRSSFAAHFAVVMGVTPADYVLNLRISTAKGLLRRGYSAKAAAAETGFSGPAVFARAFRRHSGLAPLAWLEQAESTAAN